MQKICKKTEKCNYLNGTIEPQWNGEMSNPKIF